MNIALPRTSHTATRIAYSIIPLAILCLLALWLRWRYVQEISLYVDEFTTLWAARQVQMHGAPLMPSGVLYTRGLLASYVEALFLTLFGFSYTVGRLPSVIFGLGTIIATWWIGKRAWRAPDGWGVGWLAAVGLALLPEAIIWSGRARFYAQLQFFALLAVWAAWRMITHPEAPKTMEPRDGVSGHAAQSKIQNPTPKIFWLFPTLFILALFSQEETVLLYPAMLLATVLWRGWREFLRREVLIAHLACLIVLGVRFAIEILGQPGYFETIQAQRPYVGLIFDLRGAWRTYAPLLVAPERMGWTLGGLLAIGAALAALPTTRWRLADLPQFHQATLFFALHFALVFAVIYSFVGASWREARYLFLVQPFWLLTGAAGAVWLLNTLAQRVAARNAKTMVTIGVAVLTILAGASLFPAAQRMFTQQVEGYDRALAHLAAARQPGDVVLSPQPPACALVLGSCDYYALQRGYEEFVITRDGAPIDRWTGSTLLNRTEQLATTVRTAPQTWFVVDGFRLATRYEPDFVRTVVEQFDIAFAERGVMVLRAAGWREQPTMVITQTFAPPVLFSPLALAGWERGEAQPGRDLHITLLWQSVQTIGQQYNTSIKIIAADGRVVQQEDGPPARGLIPTNLFFDMPLPDPKALALPADLPAGRYRIEVSAYDVATVTSLREPYALDWFTVGPSPTEPEQTIDARWENGLRLLGMDAIPTEVRPGETIALRLVWTTDAPVTEDYTVFVHLVGADGQPIAQSDRAPEGGFYPASAWEVGEWVSDSYELAVPTDTPDGEYRLIIGWYQSETNERLRGASEQEAIILHSITIN